MIHMSVTQPATTHEFANEHAQKLLDLVRQYMSSSDVAPGGAGVYDSAGGVW